VLDALRSTFPKASLQRLEANFDATSAGGQPLESRCPYQKPRTFYYAGLPQRPWYEPSDYPELERISQKLAAFYPEVREEYLRATTKAATNPLVRYPSSELRNTEGDSWAGYTLWNRGRFTSGASKLFPSTVGLVHELEAELFPVTGEVVFLRLRPGTRLPAHCDSTNLQLTCHLGIEVPEGCGIRVGEEARTWREGSTLFFDHSFEHEAWNEGTSDRTVLLLNLTHPDLNAPERYLLRRLGQALAMEA
jgi:aspartyl/asparaginyl beta-hydroxylase (cupin superfamily)